MALSLRTEHGAQPLVQLFQSGLIAQRLHLLYCLQAASDTHSVRAHIPGQGKLSRSCVRPASAAAVPWQVWCRVPGTVHCLGHMLEPKPKLTCGRTHAHSTFGTPSACRLANVYGLRNKMSVCNRPSATMHTL